MEIIRYDNYNGNMNLLFDRISFENHLIKKMRKQSTEELDNYILNVLNIIGSKVYYVNIKDGYYSCDENRIIPLDSFSSSEKLFALCCLAEYTHEKIYISEYLKILSADNFRLFIKLFRDSKYVSIILPRQSFNIAIRVVTALGGSVHDYGYFG